MTVADNPYKTLGVSQTATQDEIKLAYRNLAKKYHPDLNPGNKSKETTFKKISAAYELIGTPEMRTKFDRGETQEQMEEAARQQYSRGRQGSSYYDTQQENGRYSEYFHNANENDFFESLFRSANKTQRHNQSGEDQLFQMEVDLRDAARGALREIKLPNGKNLQIKIPAGIETGSKLRFKGQGGQGAQGMPAGDVYVEVRVKPLTGFKRAGKDIETEVSVSFIEAILGAEINVPTIDGNVQLKVPAGVTTGTRLRIKGKGITAEPPGDQIVLIKIVMPKTITPELIETAKQWADKFSYDPRANP
jgi:DnaJ-class molecular chaperone